MKKVAAALVAGAMVLAAVPAFAQGTDNGSSGSVRGLGPGGNGQTGNGSGAPDAAAGTAGSAPAGASSGASQDQVLQQQDVPAGNKPAE